MPRKAGRRPGFKMTDDHRQKIAQSAILASLIAHVEGKRPMKATQVSAGIALLKKVLPDLQAVQVTGGKSGSLNINSLNINLLKEIDRNKREEFLTFIRLLQSTEVKQLEASEVKQEEKEDDTN